MSISHGDEMEGVEVTRTNDPIPPLMTAEELRVLSLYDRLEELQLEIALLKAQGTLSQEEPVVVSEEDIKVAETELLHAKAVYQVRKNVIDEVLIANPVVKAVHAGTHASVIEQDLLPQILQRDELSIALSSLSAKVLAATEELKATESEHVVLARANAELSGKMLRLAAAAESETREDITDPETRRQLDELEAALKIARQRWRIMKGTASVTIIGSGVNWAQDPKLLEIVLDDEEG